MKSSAFQQFGLVRDMLETVDIVARFDPQRVASIGAVARVSQRVFFTGEGKGGRLVCAVVR